MLTLSTQLTPRGDQYNYYYDFKKRQLCIVKYSLEEIENNKTKIFIATSFTGATYTFLTSSFRGIYVNLNYFLSISFVILIVLLSFFISKKYDEHLLERGNVKDVDINELSELFYKGNNRRPFQMLFLLIYFLVLLFAWPKNNTVIDFFTFCLLILSIVCFICFAMAFSPIQIIKFKLYIRRCKKECQNK